MSTVTLNGLTGLGMLGEAVLSEDMTYRYTLDRRWDRGLDIMPWIMLNPSTADHTTDDATIIRCCARAIRSGYGGIFVANLFALRATSPAQLRAHPDPVGPDNDKILASLARSTGYGTEPVIVAWGAHGSLSGRDKAVLKLLGGCRLLCLGTTKTGQPRHPVRLGYDVPYQPFPATLAA